MTFSFTSRETYLNYRADWKVAYAQLTKDQRAAKLALKEMHKKGIVNYQLYDALAQVSNNVRKANEQLAELSEAKVEAQRQYLAART